MKSIKDIDYIKGFCDIIGAKFARTLLEEISYKKEDMIKNEKLLETSISQEKRMVQLIGNKDYEFSIVTGQNRYVALNIINWILEK